MDPSATARQIGSASGFFRAVSAMAEVVLGLHELMTLLDSREAESALLGFNRHQPRHDAFWRSEIINRQTSLVLSHNQHPIYSASRS